MLTYDKVIDDILVREGDKFTRRATDRGGPTKFGITQRTLSQFRGRPVTPEEVSQLTRQEAKIIYLTLYVRGPGFSQISDELLLALTVDCGVLHGQGRVTKWIQEIVGATKDGIWGPGTSAAVATMNPRELCKKLLATRIRFIGRIITDDPTQAEYAAGWFNRCAEFMEAL